MFTCICIYCYFFFFSSRRRHTRLQGDWSSDVCSSDLGLSHVMEGRRVFEDLTVEENLVAATYALTGRNQVKPDFDRSEEHTSELQSPCNLVCRLLLEKKKHVNLIIVTVVVF